MAVDIPEYAKRQAKRALEIRKGKPKSQKGGTDAGLGIARRLINSNSISNDTAKKIGTFKRFFKQYDKDIAAGKRDSKTVQAVKLWGGKRFITKMSNLEED